MNGHKVGKGNLWPLEHDSGIPAIEFVPILVSVLPISFLFWIRIRSQFCPYELSFCTPSDKDPITGSHKVLNSEVGSVPTKIEMQNTLIRF